ncbi:thioredoxin-disulfide reductase [Rubrobacter radiotolerans]|uniref:Thioredoxin reductase n=1 Tax=Rubrobacter radiotolerans TaxID=42256 RepID=A0A023WYP9_RUBRA|nr:thioredoxin-disulfide reductase [Rubrobacter radiotolerans]AHY45357.1 thioredoxin-disulfide reductase [Rubrobacter radiotolerans]MDX5892768.1 thioredoxin-disulfide reductase [Rubrobacter radiotolerans]SMC02460.1 thioredoxin reductase (NADPH) [Rubrobacter radiotolerans DSM 5868]
MPSTNGTSADVYDTVIIGSGPAGYTAALYASRANMKTLLFKGWESGGQLMLTTDVENFPGYKDGVMGPEMMEDLEAQAARFGAELRPDEIERVDFSERPFRLWAEGEEEPVLANTVIIATGAKAKWLGLENEQRLMGRGVSGCATCDGFFFRDKPVAVVGGGDTAMEEALYLTNHASEVNLIHRRDEFRASRIMLDRARKNEKINIITDTVVEDILGDDTVTGARLLNKKTGDESEIKVDGFFTAIGHEPATALFKDKVEMDPEGYILQKEHTMTSVPGVFAAGDVSDRRYRQAVTAAADGCRAAIDAARWLEEQGEADHADDPGEWISPKDEG